MSGLPVEYWAMAAIIFAFGAVGALLGSGR